MKNRGGIHRIFIVMISIIMTALGDTNISTFLSAESVVDWSHCGTDYDTAVQYPINQVNASSAQEIIDAINDTTRVRNQQLRIVLSEGDYNFGSQQLELDSNIVIRGSGPDSTRLLFDVGENAAAILIQGQEISSVYSAIDPLYIDCLNFKSKELYVQSISGFGVGDIIVFEVNQNGLFNWRANKWGQITKIIEINPSTTIFKFRA